MGNGNASSTHRNESLPRTTGAGGDRTLENGVYIPDYAAFPELKNEDGYMVKHPIDGWVWVDSLRDAEQMDDGSDDLTPLASDAFNDAPRIVDVPEESGGEMRNPVFGTSRSLVDNEPHWSEVGGYDPTIPVPRTAEALCGMIGACDAAGLDALIRRLANIDEPQLLGEILSDEAMRLFFDRAFAFQERGDPPFTHFVYSEEVGHRPLEALAALFQVGTRDKESDWREDRLIIDARRRIEDVEYVRNARNDARTVEHIRERAEELWIETYHRHPFGAKFYLRHYFENADSDIYPYVLLARGAADLYWRDDVGRFAKNSEVLYFADMLATRGDDTENKKYDNLDHTHILYALASEFDFENPEHFFRTGTLIEFIGKVHRELGVASMEELDQSPTYLALREAVEKSRGSYLLNLRAGDVLAHMERTVGQSESHRSMEVFEDAHVRSVPYAIAPGMLGIDGRDGFFVCAEGEQTYRPLAMADVAGPHLRETDAEREQDAENLHDLRFMLSRSVSRHIRGELKIPLEELTLREQYHLLNYLKSQDKHAAMNLSTFALQYGRDGLRTFLALDYDESFGDRLVFIGRVLPHHLAAKVFDKYSAIADAAERTEAFLLKQFPNTETDPNHTARRVSERLLRKGKSLLLECSDAIDRLYTRLPKASMLDIVAFQKQMLAEFEKLEKKLEEINAETLLFHSAFRSLFDSGVDVRLDDIKDAALEVHHGATDDPEFADLVAKMRAIYAENYADHPEERDMLLVKFDAEAKDPRSRFHTFTYKDELEGFVRFDDIAPGVREAASFNVAKQAQGQRIADAMIEQVIRKEAREAVLFADCDARKLAMRYVNLGFVGIAKHKEGGRTIMDIVWDEAANAKYLGKTLATEELAKLADDPDGAKERDVRIEVTSTPGGVTYAPIAEGYVLTNIVRDEGGHGARFLAVYERNASSIQLPVTAGSGVVSGTPESKSEAKR